MSGSKELIVLGPESQQISDLGPFEQGDIDMIELASRRTPGIEVSIWWIKASEMIVLEAVSETGVLARTVVPNDMALDSLSHPAQYFSGQTNEHLFG